MDGSNPAAQQKSPAGPCRPVVLFLDDDPEILGSFRRLLRKEPYQVVTTGNPTEALARLRSSCVEVVIADEWMPRISGRAFLKMVEERWPKTARLIVSGHPEVAESVQQQGGLVQHFIPKPWDVDELRALLRGLIERRKARRAQAPAPAASPPGRAWDFMVERPVVIDAAGRTVEDVGARILGFLQRARVEGRDVVAVLEGFERMKEAPRKLLSQLAMGVDSSGTRLYLIEPFGIAANFFRSSDEFHPRIKVFEPEADPTRTKALLLVDPVDSRRVFLRLLLAGLGHSCLAVATPKDARSALDAQSYDMVFLELTHADDDAINLVRDLARTKRGTEVVPMLSFSRAWAPSIARKWNLLRPLVRPHRLMDLIDTVR